MEGARVTAEHRGHEPHPVAHPPMADTVADDTVPANTVPDGRNSEEGPRKGPLDRCGTRSFSVRRRGSDRASCATR